MKKIFLIPSIIVTFAMVFTPSCGSEGGDNETTEGENESTENKEIETKDADYETITFEATDGLEVTANHYQFDETSPIIVLCHQARFNKFEYDGVAQRLNDMGFNCIAIDQRSGGPIAKEQNETNLRAKEQGLGVDYLDAIADIKGAVDFAAEEYQQDVILWGSSYSSTLVLWEALENEKVKAVVSFSPGDYFPNLGSLKEKLAELEIPCFLTAADFEIEGPGGLTDLTSNMELGENQTIFAPDSNGHHGSRALWLNQDGGEQYWEAITEFLNTQK